MWAPLFYMQVSQVGLMCLLSVALHYVLVLLTVTINTIAGERFVDVFSE